MSSIGPLPRWKLRGLMDWDGLGASLHLLSSGPFWQVGQHIFSLRSAEAKVQQVFGRPSPVPFGRAKSFFPASAVLRGSPETQGSSAERFKWQFRAADVLELRFPAQTSKISRSLAIVIPKWLKPPSYDDWPNLLYDYIILHTISTTAISCHGSSTQAGRTFKVAAPSAGRTQMKTADGSSEMSVFENAVFLRH